MTIDRLEEIRQRTEAGRPIRRIDMKYLLSEVDRMNALHKREIIVTGEYAQRVIDLTARAEQAERERDAAKADLHHNDACSVCIGAEQGICKDCDLECLDCRLDCRCKDCRDENKWEWRGAREGEGKENG